MGGGILGCWGPMVDSAQVVERSGRPTLRRLFPRRVAIVCAVVLLAQAVALAVLVRDVHDPRPHHAPVSVVAPAVVAHALAAQADALPGRPFDVTPTQDRPAALRDLRRGLTVGVVLVDLAHTEDTLVLSGAVDQRLTAAVRDQVEALERSHGRTVRVRTTSASGVSDDVVRGLAAGYGGLGFLLALLVSLRFGPVARTVRLGTRRILLVAAVSLAAAYLTVLLLPGLDGLDGPAGLEVTAALALTALVAATLTLALEGVVGFGGLGLSAVLYLVLATPQLLGMDRRLLPDPWPRLAGWTPPGAGLDAVSAGALFDGTGLRRPLLVLAVWLAAAVATLLVSRGERRRLRAAPEAGLDRPLLAPAARHGRLVRWRWRVAVTVVPAAVAALAVVAVVPRDAVARAAPVPSRASRTECVSTGHIRTVADLNRIARTVRGGPDFLGADIGADTELQDGRRLMVFGDTLRRDGFVRNSMLLLGGECIQAVRAEDRGALIPDRPSAAQHRVGYWPMSVVSVHKPGYDEVVVTCQRVRGTDAGGVLGFENLGPAVAVFVVPRGATPQLVALKDLGPDLADASRPAWGAAAALDHGWLYLYGTANPGRPYVFGFSLRVARMRPDDVLHPAAWTYWDGSGWVADPDRAVELVPAEGGTSQTLSVFERGGTWYALSKRNEFLGTDVVVWKAADPWGPFDGGTSVASLPSDAADGRLRYMPLAHPGLLPRPGTVVVSYSQNRTDVGKVVDDPFLYRPRFLRVTLP